MKQELDELVKALGNKAYFIGIVDTDAKGGGTVTINSNLGGTDFCLILDAAFPTSRDLANLGIYVGSVISARNTNTKKLQKNGKSKSKSGEIGTR